MFLVVLLFVICTGLAVAHLDTWGPLYKLDLIVHPLLALAVSGYLVRYMVGRIETTAPSLSTRRWVLGPVVFSVVSGVVGALTPTLMIFLGLLTAQTVYYGLGAWRLSQAISRRRLPKAIALGYTLFAAWNLSLFTGVAILIAFRRGGVTHLFQLHATLGSVFIAVLVFFLIVIGVGGFERLSRERVRQTRPWAIAVKLLTAAGLIIIGTTLHQATPDPEAVVSLSSIPLAERDTSELQVQFTMEGVAPAGMGLTHSCLQEGGCHSALSQSFLHSNHAISMRTKHMQKSLRMLMKEESAEDWRTCAGCHAPAALFDPAKGPRDFFEQPAISCLGCHLIEDVSLHTSDERRSTVTHVAPAQHIGLFVDESGDEQAPSAFDAALIQLSPRSHGRMFSTSLTGEDLMCAACHHQRIPFEEAVGIQQAQCKNCHLPKAYASYGEQPLRDHFSAGAAVGIPVLLDDELAVERILRWIAGEQRIVLNGWEMLWDIRRHRRDAPPAATWIKMFHVAQSPATPGQEYRFHVQSSNVGMNHNFPAGEPSMSEAWLEVRVTDKEGKTLFHVGKLDGTGRVPADAPRLGGRTLDAAGDPIREFRLWKTHRKVVDAAIPARLHRDDDFSFVIPKHTKGPLIIEGQWNYRKHSRELLDWAYGKSTKVNPVAVGQFRHELTLDDVPGGG